MMGVRIHSFPKVVLTFTLWARLMMLIDSDMEREQHSRTTFCAQYK
jgi:hypothetical protein